ncbi:MAG: DUF4433 domain-containing protein [Candidatus Omnitrophota bacterium]
MDRIDITELYFIAPVVNVPSIMKHGILSHNLAKQMEHDSVAMPEIQERRENKQIPGAERLHDYVNLYFDAHNPMLSKCRARNNEICVLRIDPAVLNLPGVIIADQNAASNCVRFFPVVDGLQSIDRNRVFAQYWTHPEDPIEEMRHKSEKCAEVLVPNRVDPHFLIGAYVANPTARLRIQKLKVNLTVSVKNDIFF